MLVQRTMLFGTCLLLFSLFTSSYCNQKYANKLLLISMDGFRWDYLEKAGKGKTPNFDKLAREGVKLPFMNNAFITKTFPNHYTIATGLYEESHGIIGNKMYDPIQNAYFNMGSKESFWWDGGEPIWVTARRQYLKSASYYWAGSESAIHGHRPNIYMKYSDTTPYQQRIDTVMDWFVNQNISVALLYFPEPDKTGHLHGPDSQEIIDKTIEMDKWLGKIMEGITNNGLEGELNMILLSDHGMANIDMNKRLISILDYVSDSDLQGMYDKGAVTNIRPIRGREQYVYDRLKAAHPNITVYKKENIPVHFHYKNNVRVQPIFVMADEGWMIAKNRSTVDPDDMIEVGAHGYDNRLTSMRPIFFARGPNFKKNYVGTPINNVDVYPLMCELLNIAPSPNNGSLKATSDFIVPLSTWDGSNGSDAMLKPNPICLLILALCTITRFSHWF